MFFAQLRITVSNLWIVKKNKERRDSYPYAKPSFKTARGSVSRRIVCFRIVSGSLQGQVIIGSADTVGGQFGLGAGLELTRLAHSQVTLLAFVPVSGYWFVIRGLRCTVGGAVGSMFLVRQLICTLSFILSYYAVLEEQTSEWGQHVPVCTNLHMCTCTYAQSIAKY